MRTGDLCPNGKEAIASLVEHTFPDVQQQDGGFDCGLYALAFGYSLCAGTDPAKLVYIQAEFRSHFLRCLCLCIILFNDCLIVHLRMRTRNTTSVPLTSSPYKNIVLPILQVWPKSTYVCIINSHNLT